MQLKTTHLLQNYLLPGIELRKRCHGQESLSSNEFDQIELLLDLRYRFLHHLVVALAVPAAQ